MYALGAVPGALIILGWGMLNCYVGVIQGDFRNNHPHCHSVADMAGVLGGFVAKEFVGGLFLIAWVLCSGAGLLGVSVALNALSDHAICTVYFSLVATVMIAITASVRTFQNLSWLTWAGFISIYVAVFIVVVGVSKSLLISFFPRPSGHPSEGRSEVFEFRVANDIGAFVMVYSCKRSASFDLPFHARNHADALCNSATRDRPAAAPATGAYELGYHAISSATTFAAGMTATTTIFVSSAGTSAFIPVVAEMRKPRDFRKALYTCMAFVTASYLTFALVVYAWCGAWVASPALGSAGPVIKKVSYGIGLIGLIVSACLYLHVAAKYLFVRLLRNSRHLQRNTLVHWGTWLGCTVGLSVIAFLLAEAIPVFNYLVAFTGSLCFAPLALCLPACLWMHDHATWRSGQGVARMTAYWLHVGLILLGIFICVGGTYSVVKQIIAAYADGTIGEHPLRFSCTNPSKCQYPRLTTSSNRLGFLLC